MQRQTRQPQKGEQMTIESIPTKVTVIFSTFNGGMRLKETLSAFSKLAHPDFGFGIIAVNNNSTDNSGDILNEYKCSLPLTVLWEEKQGKNHALNNALQKADGDLIVFTDDDVIPDKEWLINLVEAARIHTAFDIFGGTILPRWPSTPPEWISYTTNLGMLYAATPNLNDGPISAGAVWGPNMAIRRTALDKAGHFNAQVGPDGSENYIMGSETELLDRLENAGHQAWFVKNAVIHHQIRPVQLNRNWALQRYFRFGRASYRLSNQRNSCKNFINGVERWLWSAYIKNMVTRIVIGPFLPEYKSVQLQEQTMFLKGQIYQSKEYSNNSRH